MYHLESEISIQRKEIFKTNRAKFPPAKIKGHLASQVLID